MTSKFPFIIVLSLICFRVSVAQERGFRRVEKASNSNISALYEEKHALVIGNARYEEGWPLLSGVRRDVTEVGNALEDQGFEVVRGHDLTKFQLDSAITEFIATYGTKEEAALLLYFAGHGHTIKTNYGEKLGYFVPVDAPNPVSREMIFQSKAMEMAQIEIYAKRIASKHALFVFDACFSGSLFSPSRAIPEVISYKTTQPVRQFISSGSEDEEVSDESIFRKQFVSAITTGDADFNDDGYLTGTELGRYLQTTVINYSNNSQHPQYGKMDNPALNKGDFVFKINQGERIQAGNSDLPVSSKGAAMKMSSIELTTEIGGDLYIDDRLIVALSPNTIIPINEIPPGVHRLEIRGPEQWEDEITLTSGEALNLRVNSYVRDRTDAPFIDMVFVQGSTYLMGGYNGDEDELPVHQVTLNDFEISAYEITVGQFSEFVEQTGYRTEAEIAGWSWVFDGEWKKKSGYNWRTNADGQPSGDMNPVVFVSWNDANAFADWMSSSYNGHYRLPTEAEWEYAARGGIHSGNWEYSGGEIGPLLGWFESNSEGKTHVVGQQKPNELNLFDMSGNVWEWCSDWYGQHYYERTSTSNPKGVLSSEYRVLRGGSWNNNESSGRVSNRHKNRPYERDSFTGFRIVRDAL